MGSRGPKLHLQHGHVQGRKKPYPTNLYFQHQTKTLTDRCIQGTATRQATLGSKPAFTIGLNSTDVMKTFGSKESDRERLLTCEMNFVNNLRHAATQVAPSSCRRICSAHHIWRKHQRAPKLVCHESSSSCEGNSNNRGITKLALISKFLPRHVCLLVLVAAGSYDQLGNQDFNLSSHMRLNRR